MSETALQDPPLETSLSRQLKIEVPLICGAMYPCSNPELVAAVSEAGGMGIIQPLSLVYVHGREFREGLAEIRRLTDKPVGMNVVVERSSKVYMDRMRAYVDAALDEGIRFFVTSLGNPRWVADRAHEVGGLVYHDVTERKWAEKGLEAADRCQRSSRWTCRGQERQSVARRARGLRGTGGLRWWCGRCKELRAKSEVGLCRCPDGHEVHRHAGVHRE